MNAPAAPAWREHVRRWRFTLMPPANPWARVATPIDWPGLVPAAPADWRGIFSGTSTAPIASVEALCDWLAGCRYCPDQTRGDGRDRWLHPLEFEVGRVGDCEDYALWAWRKLVELGLAAEFVLGAFESAGDALAVNHAWVHVGDGRQWWLLETTAPRDRMLVVPAAARAAYLPAAAIDHRLVSHGFANFFHLRAGHALLRLPAATA